MKNWRGFFADPYFKAAILARPQFHIPTFSIEQKNSSSNPTVTDRQQKLKLQRCYIKSDRWILKRPQVIFSIKKRQHSVGCHGRIIIPFCNSRFNLYTNIFAFLDRLPSTTNFRHIPCETYPVQVCFWTPLPTLTEDSWKKGRRRRKIFGVPFFKNLTVFAGIVVYGRYYIAKRERLGKRGLREKRKKSKKSYVRK